MCALIVAPPKRILVIDDDIDLLMLLERSLGNEGFVVETAASLPEAEEIIDYFTPHLVLLDINVKGDDGRQLCWKLKKSPAGDAVKVVLMSGYDVNTSRAVLFGADELLSKPLHIDFLMNSIRTHLHQHRKSNGNHLPLSSNDA